MTGISVTKRKNPIVLCSILFCTMCADSVMANGYVVSHSDEALMLIAGFFGWVVLGVAFFPFTRRSHNIPFIILTILVTFIGIQGDPYLIQILTLWVFYVCWLLFFQVTVPSERTIDNVLSIIRHGVAILLMVILTGMVMYLLFTK